MIEREPVLGLIAGTNLLREAPFVAAVETRVHTPYGEVRVQHAGPLALVLRHGLGGDVPPHRIPHRAHVTALGRVGVHGVICLCSVGSLRPNLRPGDFVVPSDFGQLSAPQTFLRRPPGSRHPHARRTPALAPAAHRPHGGPVAPTTAASTGR